jgi:hypothetical protein
MRAVLLVVVLLAACSPVPAPAAGLLDAGADDGGAVDAGAVDGGADEDDAGAADGGAADGDAGFIDNEWGFSMRAPRTRSVPCEDCDQDVVEAVDVDHVCTLTVDGHDAVVYVAATPTSIERVFFPLPVYDDVRAFVREDGGIVAVDGAYDFGGNHHNDFFSITYAGARFTFDHSTYGFGFRACRPPDCLKIEVDGGSVDGCQPTRTIPETCIEVAAPLPPLVDTFAICPGDGG